MTAADLSVGNDVCAAHGDRPAVDRCASCGRTVCLACAVPVRGEVLCTECAARAVGDPAPIVVPQRRTRVPHAVAAGLLALTVAGTIPSWERFGAPFAAWRTTVVGWGVLTALSLTLAFAAAVVATSRSRPRTIPVAAYSVLAAAGAGGTAWQVLASPDYVGHTAAPYAVAALAFAAAVIGAARLRRER